MLRWQFGGPGRQFACALLIAVAAISTFAQSVVKLPVTDGSDLRFTHISFSSEGPSRGRVSRIARDARGFLWFGTQDGVKRYDGYRFRDFRPQPEDPHALSGNFVSALFTDRDGRVWVGADRFLDWYDPETESFTQFRSDQFEGLVWQVNQDRDGVLWVATEHGLNRIDPTGRSTVRYSHKSGDPSTLSSEQVGSTFESREGAFWVATFAGVDLFDRRAGNVIRHFPFPGHQRYVVLVDHAEIAWVINPSKNIFAAIAPRTGSVTHYTFDSAETTGRAAGILGILEDEDGVLWLGTFGNGLLKLDRERRHLTRYRQDPTDPDSLSADRVDTLFEDQEGNIWAGTTGGGVNRVPRTPPAFKYFRHKPAGRFSLPSDFVSTILEDRRGELWFGSRDALTKMDRKTGATTLYRSTGKAGGLSNSFVLSIAEDGEGYLWFGTAGGLNRFDPRTGRFQSYLHRSGDETSISNDSINRLLVARDGTLWAATDAGLNRYDSRSGHFQHFRAPGEDRSSYRAISEAPDGMLWLGTWGLGIQRFDPRTGSFTVYRRSQSGPGGPSNDIVNTVYVDRSGTVWAGTQSGLNRLSDSAGAFKTYYESNGLPNSNVTGILEDDRGYLWLSTNNGLSRFDPRDETFHNYYRSDGLLADEFYGSYSAYRSRSGEMFFCSYVGVTAFRPEEVRENPFVPPVVFTDFLLSGREEGPGRSQVLRRSITATSSLTLTHEQNIFAVEFSALSFSSPSRNRYRYQLERVDREWISADANHRIASYTPGPGRYVLRVQGSNNQGRWNTEGATLKIEILAPWWNTAAFRAAILAAVGILVWVLHRLRVRRLAGELNLRFEERLQERTRIAQDLHDTLLQGFLSISMQLHVASEQIPKELPARAAIERLLVRVRQVIAEGRQALGGLRGERGETGDLERTLARDGNDFRGSREVNFRVVVEGTRRPLHPVIRDEIYRIGREALANAFQHAKPAHVEVDLEYTTHHLKLRVQDDGAGIDPQIVESGRSGHWGMQGMRERALQIGAKLKLLSNPNAGTEVELTVPAQIAFLTESASGTSPAAADKEPDRGSPERSRTP